ncbi:MAG TPA: GNAT family N-acetyltransferase [Meiothermus sp.]|nr:GNAT family N-acetyltransferase [Meiothermus sp.]
MHREAGQSLNIRTASEADAGRIAEIYNWYVLNTTVSFETEAVSPQEMEKRIQERLERYDWLVGESEGRIVGYAYYGSFRPRAAYNHTVEVTVYLEQASIGKGFGQALYRELIESAANRGFRELIGVIALPDRGSIALHRKMGFREIGVLEQVGHKFGQYIDVALWQKSIPRP